MIPSPETRSWIIKRIHHSSEGTRHFSLWFLQLWITRFWWWFGLSLPIQLNGRRRAWPKNVCQNYSMPFPLYKVIIPLQISPCIGCFSTTGKVSVTIDQPKRYLPGTPRQRGLLHGYTAVEYGNRILKNQTSVFSKRKMISKSDFW